MAPDIALLRQEQATTGLSGENPPNPPADSLRSSTAWDWTRGTPQSVAEAAPSSRSLRSLTYAMFMMAKMVPNTSTSDLLTAPRMARRLPARLVDAEERSTRWKKFWFLNQADVDGLYGIGFLVSSSARYTRLIAAPAAACEGAAVMKVELATTSRSFLKSCTASQ